MDNVLSKEGHQLHSMMVNKMEIFEQIEQLISDKNYKKAIEIIEANQPEIFKQHPIETINNHIYCLIESGEYNRCYEVLETYNSYPYLNIEVEEYFSIIREKLPRLIDKAIEQKNSAKYRDKNGVDFSLFHSKKESDIIAFITQIHRSQQWKEYEFELENILKRNISDTVTFLTLSALFNANSRKLVDFQYKSSSFSVDFANFVFPFKENDKEYFELHKYFSNEINDVSIQKTCQELLVNLRVEIFPETFAKNELENIKKTVIFMAKKLFNINEKIDFDSVDKKYLKLLEKIINS